MSDTEAPPRPQDHDKNLAILAFVLGIIGVVACQLTGPIAWYLGASYRRRCQDEGIEPDPLGMVGMILGILSTALLVLSMVVMVGFCGLYAVIAFFGVAVGILTA